MSGNLWLVQHRDNPMHETQWFICEIDLASGTVLLGSIELQPYIMAQPRVSIPFPYWCVLIFDEIANCEP